jgi:hypothetical protein
VCVDSARAQKVVELVAKLETLDRIADLVALVAPPVKL